MLFLNDMWSFGVKPKYTILRTWPKVNNIIQFGVCYYRMVLEPKSNLRWGSIQKPMRVASEDAGSQKGVIVASHIA